MECPKCGCSTRVTVSGKVDSGTLIRHKQCCDPACAHSFTTIETRLNDQPDKEDLFLTLVDLVSASKDFAITMIGQGHVPAFTPQDKDDELPQAALNMRRLIQALVVGQQLSTRGKRKELIDALQVIALNPQISAWLDVS